MGTPNCMLYGEANSVDMLTMINQRMINFWLKLENDDELKLSNILCKILSRDFDHFWSLLGCNQVPLCVSELTFDCVFMLVSSFSKFTNKIFTSNFVTEKLQN